jgi:hypothetical protein
MTNVVPSVRKAALTTWEGAWYALMNVALGAGYLRKVPAKKAMQDYGLVEMSTAEQLCYGLECLCFGAGYLAKIPTARALSELAPARSPHATDSLGQPDGGAPPPPDEGGRSPGSVPPDASARGEQGQGG